MKIEYSQRAVSDLDQIAVYYASSGDAAAGEKIETAIRGRIAHLTKAPLFGRAISQRSGVRLILLVRYRYKIFYRVLGTTVRIIHIRHMSRRPWPPA